MTVQRPARGTSNGAFETPEKGPQRPFDDGGGQSTDGVAGGRCLGELLARLRRRRGTVHPKAGARGRGAAQGCAGGDGQRVRGRAGSRQGSGAAPQHPDLPSWPSLEGTWLPTPPPPPPAVELGVGALGCHGGQAKLPGESIPWPRGEHPGGNAGPSLGESIPGLWGEHPSASGRASPLGNASLGLEGSLPALWGEHPWGNALLRVRKSIPWPQGEHPLALGKASLGLGESIPWLWGTHPLGKASPSLRDSIPPPWERHPLGYASLRLGESIPRGTHPSASEKASLGESIPRGRHPSPGRCLYPAGAQEKVTTSPWG